MVFLLLLAVSVNNLLFLASLKEAYLIPFQGLYLVLNYLNFFITFFTTFLYLFKLLSTCEVLVNVYGM